MIRKSKVCALALSLSVSPAAAETAKMADSFVDSIGVNMHVGSTMDYNPNWTAIQNAMVNSGVRYIRDYIWDATTYNTYVAPMLTAFKNAWGIDLKYMLTQQAGCTPGSANPMGVPNVGLPIANIVGFEGLNEWNGYGSTCGSGNTWNVNDKNFQISLWNAVTGTPAISALPVIGPSIGEWGGSGLTKQQQTTNDANTLGLMTSYMNIGNVHDYCTSTAPSCDFSWTAAGLSGMNGTGNPFVVSETGWTNGDVTQAVANNYFSRLFFEWFNYGATRTFVYEMLDQPSIGAWQGGFGLLNSDGTYKPAMTTISNLIAILKDPGASFMTTGLAFTTSGGDSYLHHTLLQKRNGTFYLALWQEHNATDTFSPYNVTVNLPSSSNVTKYTPISSSSGTVIGSHVSSVVVSINDQATILAIAPACN